MGTGAFACRDRYKIQFGGGDEFDSRFLCPDRPLTIGYRHQTIAAPLNRGGVSILREFEIIDGQIAWASGESAGIQVFLTIDEPDKISGEVRGTSVMLVDRETKAVTGIGRATIWRVLGE